MKPQATSRTLLMISISTAEATSLKAEATTRIWWNQRDRAFYCVILSLANFIEIRQNCFFRGLFQAFVLQSYVC